MWLILYYIKVICWNFRIVSKGIEIMWSFELEKGGKGIKNGEILT